MRQLSLSELQKESLNIMKVVHMFCVENDIQYSLDAGSLLGAIRHKGFIPWDDDIDIMMTRPNYEKFCKSFDLEGYKLLDYTRKNSFLPFARVCDISKTTIVNKRQPFTTEEVGYWIDIFPIDGAPAERSAFDKYCRRFHNFNRLCWAYRMYECLCKNGLKEMVRIHPFRKIIQAIAMKCYLLLSRQTIFDIIAKDHHILKKYSFEDADICGSLAYSFNWKREYKRTTWFNEYALKTFEDTEFYVLLGWHEYLTEKFGDYMRLPPEDQRVPAHTFLKVYYKDERNRA